MKTIYLAGGMHTEWRQLIRELRDDAVFLDPTTHGLDVPSEYTAWDLAAIEKSDIVFGYMEDNNPSGMGLNLEVGYAKALGKVIILVDETDNKYMGMCRSCADYVTAELLDGIGALEERL